MNVHPKRGGFTLMEVVLAAGLFVVGMSVILGVFNFGSAMTRTAELRSVGAEAVDALAADLEETLFPLLPNGVPGPPVAIDDRPVPGHPGLRYSVQVTANMDSMETVPGADEPLPREYSVQIHARWKASGVNKSATWTTILLREQRLGARLRRLFDQ